MRFVVPCGGATAAAMGASSPEVGPGSSWSEDGGPKAVEGGQRAGQHVEVVGDLWPSAIRIATGGAA